MCRLHWHGMQNLGFAPWQSCVDTSFWRELNIKKLDELKLSEEPICISGFYCPSHHDRTPSPLELDSSAFGQQLLQGRKGYHKAPGTLYNLNSIDGFKAFDRKAAAEKVAREIWDAISSGACIENPSLLCRFLLMTHADLKKYHYHYRFAFPVIKPPSPFTASPIQRLSEALGEDQAAKICSACDVWRTSEEFSAPFWLIKNRSTDHPVAVKLGSWTEASQEASDGDGVYLCASDFFHEKHPGWMLRNCLLFVAKWMKISSVTVVCVKGIRGATDPKRSLVFTVNLPEIPDDFGNEKLDFVSGWEVDSFGKSAPRFMDMRSQFDDIYLSEEAVNLNLKLMLWRAAPNLDTEKVAQAKCLLLGMGTLGCMVARTLMGWGVKNLTLVDSGTVSFSNPVRQSLYEFEDCLEGGKPKADCAADHLRKIFPSINVESRNFEIPMPGHPPRDSEEAEQHRETITELNELIKTHDAIFLMMDTRESRWLPTVICAALGKVAINIALGFDGFLVMRHGAPTENEQGKKLGCYFCNDVVAPLNSMTDRALDQQCTVARPGLAPIASALGVELFVSLLQHPMGINAPPLNSSLTGEKDSLDAEDDSTGAFGGIPHMIRGRLHGFSQTCMEGLSFSQCTACSPLVVDGYNSGIEFVENAIQDPKCLEDLTGLTALHQETEKLVLNFDDDPETASENSDDWTEL
ncbi:hypothetical protein BSKO_12826 [Bryopsis sp. KO-2023]|nr:hypothetical protein BSKO_12826 [Bryopsis sp. KO-2023]